MSLLVLTLLAVATALLLLASLGLEKGIQTSVERRLMSAAQASVHSGKK